MSDHTPPRPRFEGTVNWGHLLIFSGIVLSAIGLYVTNAVTVGNHETRIATLEQNFIELRGDMKTIIDQLGDIRVDVASLKAASPAVRR